MTPEYLAAQTAQCDSCGAQYTLQLSYLVVARRPRFCPWCGRTFTRRVRAGKPFEQARCFKFADRRLLEHVWPFWIGRASLRSRFPTLLAYLKHLVRHPEELP